MHYVDPEVVTLVQFGHRLIEAAVFLGRWIRTWMPRPPTATDTRDSPGLRHQRLGPLSVRVSIVIPPVPATSLDLQVIVNETMASS